MRQRSQNDGPADVGEVVVLLIVDLGYGILSTIYGEDLGWLFLAAGDATCKQGGSVRCWQGRSAPGESGAGGHDRGFCQVYPAGSKRVLMVRHLGRSFPV